MFLFRYFIESKRSLIIGWTAWTSQHIEENKIQFEDYYPVLLCYNCAGLSVRKQDKVGVGSLSLCAGDSVRGLSPINIQDPKDSKQIPHELCSKNLILFLLIES